MSPDRFDNRLLFDVKILPYEIKLDWIEKALYDARACLEMPQVPMLSPSCDFCKYALKLKEKHIFEISFPQMTFDFKD